MATTMSHDLTVLRRASLNNSNARVFTIIHYFHAFGSIYNNATVQWQQWTYNNEYKETEKSV